MTDEKAESPVGSAPQPKAEPPDPPPGGADALPDVGSIGPYTSDARDPNPAKNPETDEIPTETTEREDTDTEATKASEESAGQQREGHAEQESSG